MEQQKVKVNFSIEAREQASKLSAEKNPPPRNPGQTQWRQPSPIAVTLI